MSATFNLKICPKALAALCEEYDGFEPSKKCLTNHGQNCTINHGGKSA